MNSSSASTSRTALSKKSEKGLEWIEWLKGYALLIYEVFFEKFSARHLQNPLPLPPLQDVNCILTGCTSGIGLEMAKQMAESGAHIIMAVRNQEAAHDLIKKWQDEWSGSGQLNIEVMELNLLSLQSVVTFAETWNSRSKPLNVLINNAGIFKMGMPQNFSKDGYETHLQVNHLGPALLSMLLLPSLMKGSPSRIVSVNSTMHFLGLIDVDDMNFTSRRRKFTSSKGYANSKLAQVMFSSILQKKLPAESGVSVVCVSPGSVRTNVGRDLPKMVQILYHFLLFFLFTPQEGARSALYAATNPKIPEYCKALKADEFPVCAYISHDCRFVDASRKIHDMETANKVWEKTMDMIGLSFDAIDKLLNGETRVQTR